MIYFNFILFLLNELWNKTQLNFQLNFLIEILSVTFHQMILQNRINLDGAKCFTHDSTLELHHVWRQCREHNSSLKLKLPLKIHGVKREGRFLDRRYWWQSPLVYRRRRSAPPPAAHPGYLPPPMTRTIQRRRPPLPAARAQESRLRNPPRPW